MFFTIIMSSLTAIAAIAVSWNAYGLAALSFSMMVGVLMAVLIEKGK